MGGTPDYLRYWGKAGHADEAAGVFHGLVHHSFDVAAVGDALLEANPALLDGLASTAGLDRGPARDLLRLGLAFHDLGKFAGGFQDLRLDLSSRLRGPHSKVLSRARHDSMGFCLWRDWLARRALAEGWLAVSANGAQLDEVDAQVFLEPWFAATFGHHGMPPETSDKVSIRLFEPEARAAAEAYARDAVAQLGPVRLDCDGATITRASWLVAGLTVLCDWIGSNRDWFAYEPQPVGLAEYWDIARSRARDALARTGLVPCAPMQGASIADLFPEIATPSPMQRLVWSLPHGDGPELLMIEEVTGSGKTEAALLRVHRQLAAGRAQGVFVGLPTMATANAMFGRVSCLVPRLFAPGREVPVVLSHSARHLAARLLAGPVDSGYGGMEEESATVTGTAWLSDHRKKALLAAVGVGTLDQALLGVLHTRHSTLRLLGLHTKVLVADEVHAYDRYTGVLLERLLEFQAALGGSAILLSATLPASMRQRFANAFARGLGVEAPRLIEHAYPLLTRVDPNGASQQPSTCRPGTEKRVGVEFLSDESQVIESLVSECERGGCACWVRNSVVDAVEAYRLIRRRLGDRALLFHARFTAGDRLDRERQVMALFGKESGPGQRAGRLLVATQVVEQSLDLDFDAMVSDLAPIDLLIQRAGRLHRHPRSADGTRQAREGRAPPVLKVLAPEFTGHPEADWLKARLKRTSFVYRDHARLWLTMRILADRKMIAVPDEARLLVESVFGSEAEAQIPPGLAKNANEAFGKEGGQASLAQFNAVHLEAGFIGRSGWGEDAEMPTRIGDPTTLLRLARFDEDRLVPLYPEPLWELSQVSVRQAQLASRVDDPRLERAVSEAEAVMPDHGKWTLTLALAPGADGRWETAALDARGVERSVSYSPQEGLLVDDEEGG